MDSYPPDKKALREAWIVGCLTIRWITSILTGKNRIFLKFPTSTSTVARYLWKLSFLHPCILWIHQITNQRLAVNVFCVDVYIWSFDVLSPQFVAILCFSTCSNEFPIKLSIYWLVYAKAIAKTQDWVLFFLSHFYLWIFVFLDLELKPDYMTEFKTVLRTFPTKIWLVDQSN